MGAGETRPRILLVPFPAQGHITPMLRLAHVLHARGFHTVIATPDFIHRRLAARADGRVGFESIPSGLGSESADSPRDFAAINRAMEEHMPAHLECLLRGSGGGAIVVVVDLLASWAIGVAVRCGVPVVGFWPAMLATYHLISAIPELIRRGFISDCGGAEEEMCIPGHAKLTTKDLPWMIGNSNSQKSRFAFWLKTLERASTLPYLLINSFSSEGGQTPGKLLLPNGPKILQIGPLLVGHHLAPSSIWEEDRSCMEWLQTQRPLSVVYVSFGSWVGPIRPEKVAELALGLELTNRPFIWVLSKGDAWRAGLPKGFVDRVGGRGKVVAWAPQEEVLSHPAVGCYLTHCGWNSTLEGIQHGKRMLCYPIAGDQFVNAAYIVNVWGIGLMLDDDVERRAVAEGIRKVVEGEEGGEIQERVHELKKRAMGREGVSRAARDLQCFIDVLYKYKNDIQPHCRK